MSKLIGLKYSSVAILMSAVATASAQPLTVVLSGAAAPGTGAGVFTTFTNPVLNASGEVAFGATITGGTSTSGIYTGTALSTPQAIALQGTAAPTGGNYGTLATTTTTSTSTSLSATGQLGFEAPLTGGTSTSGVFLGTTAATLQAIALQGTAAPAGGNYNAFLANGTNAASSVLVNSTGQVAIQSTLTGGTAAAGIFTGTSAASLQTVALVGGTAPTPPGGTYATTVTVPTLNASGQVAFVSIVGGLQGIFAGAPGAAQTVMYQGTAAPGAGGQLYGTPTTAYSYNNAGQVAFVSSLTGTSGLPTTGVFVGAPGSVQNIALGQSTGGSLAPGGTGGSFTTLSSVTVNGLGQVAFTGGLTGGTSATGLFLGSTSSNLQAVALIGGTSPDGATYSSFGSTELTNGNGEVAFLANLSGAGITTGVNSEELVAGMPGNLTELVREGDVVDGLTVNGFGLLTGSGGQDGKGTIFNDLNEVTYRLTFTDGSTGVFESIVPEPTSLGLIAVGVGALMRRSRRHFN